MDIFTTLSNLGYGICHT